MTHFLSFALAFSITLAVSQTRAEFEVASIKPSGDAFQPNQRSYGNGAPGKYIAKNTPLIFVIEQAYGIRSPQILGAPDWIRSDGYEMLAKAEVSAEEARDARRSEETHMFGQDTLRLLSLLEDRFSLKAHRETRNLPVYALIIAKGGLKVHPPNCVAWDPDHARVTGPSQPIPSYCGLAPYEQNRASFKITASGTTMRNLARSLSHFAERPVIDRTGYAEPFNATVEWYDADSKYASPADSPGPGLFTALQEQLGLRLESTKGPVEVLVVDHVERPSAN